jgi:hypothetical protein
LVLAACFHASAISQTTVAGQTPGSFRVTESGAASYTIPLQIPPGIAGMEPKLSLVYIRGKEAREQRRARFHIPLSDLFLKS